MLWMAHWHIHEVLSDPCLFCSTVSLLRLIIKARNFDINSTKERRKSWCIQISPGWKIFPHDIKGTTNWLILWWCFVTECGKFWQIKSYDRWDNLSFVTNAKAKYNLSTLFQRPRNISHTWWLCSWVGLCIDNPGHGCFCRDAANITKESFGGLQRIVLRRSHHAFETIHWNLCITIYLVTLKLPATHALKNEFPYGRVFMSLFIQLLHNSIF